MQNAPSPESLKREGRVTLYFRGMLGVCKVEAKQVEITVRPYAQYQRAVEFRFRKPRQRIDRGAVQTYQPSLLVLDGWNHPEPGARFEPVSSDGDLTVSRACYSACDPRWQTDFDAMIAAHIEATGARVLADYRNHNPS